MSRRVAWVFAYVVFLLLELLVVYLDLPLRTTLMEIYLLLWFFAGLLFGRGVGRVASLVFYMLGALASGVVVYSLGYLYRFMVPPLYPKPIYGVPSPLDVPVYVAGFYVWWRIQCVAKRWGGELSCPRQRRISQS
ncbi:hypothetical protein P186_0166 [Pyrobaculum ferrireducens]|uniref:Uncharacterized protein n=1 Tax=Pyrobaculum ferrireducens TaxID=1104324 RepID=G7VEK3_9CREN|nr:hypothetical protein P186_0166 [Pyrobaculum ferrireducens]